MPPDEHERLVQLRAKMVEHFGDGELRTLCFDLGLDYADLPGEDRADKIRELVAHCQRHGLIPELSTQCKKQFPKEDWGEADSARLFVNVPPLPPHALVGRDELLADVRAQLVRGGAVAITALNGMPGVGKTTLTLAWCTMPWATAAARLTTTSKPCPSAATWATRQTKARY